MQVSRRFTRWWDWDFNREDEGDGNIEGAERERKGS